MHAECRTMMHHVFNGPSIRCREQAGRPANRYRWPKALPACVYAMPHNGLLMSHSVVFGSLHGSLKQFDTCQFQVESLQRLSVFCSRRGVFSLATRHHKTPWFAWLCSLLACWLCMPTSGEHRSSQHRTVRKARALPHKGRVTQSRTGVVKALG
eukprot:s340_g12.t1